MGREYYKLWYRLDGDDGYLIWYSDEKDGVAVDSGGKVPSFRHAGGLLEYAAAHGLTFVEGDMIPHNLDALAVWLQKQELRRVDCDSLLTAWNLFADVSRSIGGGFDTDPELTVRIYEKIFWGNNLSAVTPAGKCYRPIWTGHELKLMREVLGFGLSLFRESLSSL